MSNKTLIIGSLPSPIGGISTFCERFSGVMLNQGFHVKFIDLYNGEKSSNLLSHNSFSYVNIFHNVKAVTYLLLACLVSLYGNRKVYFNFSTARSVYFLFFLSMIVRLRRGESFLILHHGDLNFKGDWFNIVRFLINVFDVIYYISEKQKCFYESIGFKGRLCKLKSYYPPIYKGQVTVRSLFPRNILISGSDDGHYNVLNTLKALTLFSEQHKIFMNISVVIYGRCGTEFKASLNSIFKYFLLSKFCKFQSYQDLNEKDFIYLLSGQDLYIRNNSVDSFGIIVADAINLGVEVLASDVCERYPGALLFKYNDQFSFINGLLDFYDIKGIDNV
ncbi:glycosyltransferase [Shewanella algae]|uniref:glycosyltransferase n=1 Tax=Shewanella algae TaxID=38313 RepID=UPI0005CD803D|nr:glycosyltransferase [Shewanella algae]